MPIARFSQIGMDLVSGLPSAQFKGMSADMFLCITDYSSKFILTEPLPKNTNTKGIIQTLLVFFMVFGVPTVIVTDNDVRWTSAHFVGWAQSLGIALNYNTANRPQGNGATEARNKLVLAALRRLATLRCNRNTPWPSLRPDATS